MQNRRMNYERHDSMWPYGLRRGSVAARLLVSRGRIPMRALMLVSRISCVGSGLCDELINSFRGVLPGVVCVGDRETSTVRGHRRKVGCCAADNKS